MRKPGGWEEELLTAGTHTHRHTLPQLQHKRINKGQDRKTRKRGRCVCLWAGENCLYSYLHRGLDLDEEVMLLWTKKKSLQALCERCSSWTERFGNVQWSFTGGRVTFSAIWLKTTTTTTTSPGSAVTMVTIQSRHAHSMKTHKKACRMYYYKLWACTCTWWESRDAQRKHTCNSQLQTDVNCILDRRLPEVWIICSAG